MSTEIKTKKPAAKTPKVSSAKKTTQKYIETVGRRKTAIARVRMFESAKNEVTINDKPLDVYFGTPALRAVVMSPLEREEVVQKFHVTVKVGGGGTRAQAEAVRHGISRVLLELHPDQKKALKNLGLLKRDSRKKERKHFGFRKARKRKQWKKR